MSSHDSGDDETRLGDSDSGDPQIPKVTQTRPPPRSERQSTRPRAVNSQAVTELLDPAPISQKAPVRLGPGTVLFGAYEIIDTLGVGGMGEVYRAKHLSLGGQRAIKVMHPELAHRSDALARFHAEAQALLDVHHPAVVGCNDLLRDDAGRVYLVMEMVDGVSLLDRIEEEPLSEEEIVKLGIRLAEGLDAAHACGVIHRDLSPDNILLPGGRVEDAKIIDFGIAKALASGEETISEGFKGKLAYASPEQLGFFGGRIDARSDLYSLGLVLCAAANGAPLEMGTTLKEAVDAREAFRAPSADIPAALRAEIAPLLALDPNERPATASQTFRSWRGEAPLPKRPRESLVKPLAFGLVLAAALAAYSFVRTPVTSPGPEAADGPTLRQPSDKADVLAALQPPAPAGTEHTRANFATLRSWLLGDSGNQASLAPSLTVTPNPVFAGAAYRVTMGADCDCYPLLFSVSGDGTEINLLYPNPYDGLVPVAPGQPFTIPASDYEFEAVGDVDADDLRLLVVEEWPDFPPPGSGFWAASWLQAKGANELVSLRARLDELRWAATGIKLEITR